MQDDYPFERARLLEQELKELLDTFELAIYRRDTDKSLATRKHIIEHAKVMVKEAYGRQSLAEKLDQMGFIPPPVSPQPPADAD